jgi:hypothetical protein
MEMTLRWKSQNDVHRSLEISLENARLHIPTADHRRLAEKRRRKNKTYLTHETYPTYQTHQA